LAYDERIGNKMTGIIGCVTESVAPFCSYTFMCLGSVWLTAIGLTFGLIGKLI